MFSPCLIYIIDVLYGSGVYIYSGKAHIGAINIELFIKDVVKST